MYNLLKSIYFIQHATACNDDLTLTYLFSFTVCELYLNGHVFLLKICC